MSFTLSQGRLIIDKGGVVRFDSEDKLLHGVSSGFNISGSIAIPALASGNGTFVNSTTTYNLGAVTAGHTQLIGAVMFSLNSNDFGQFPNRWHTIMGGSIVWVMDGEPGTVSSLGNNGLPRQCIIYHFRINGGQAQLVRRAFLDDIPFNYTVLGHTITYKLRSGNWT